MSTRISGSTMMSLTPASRLRTLRMERGRRWSRTMSRTTTASSRPARRQKERLGHRHIKQQRRGAGDDAHCDERAGPSTSAGVSQSRPTSSTCSFSASRKSTNARLAIATASSTSSWTSMWKLPLVSTQQEAEPQENDREGDRATHDET